MAGRSSKADNRGNDLFGFLASGKGKAFHTYRDGAAALPPSGLTATGGVISDYTDGPAVYRAHIFTSSGTFDVTAPGSFGDNVEYLVVAGGGASGFSAYSGGGGGGGFRTNVPGHPLASPTAFPVSTSPGSYTVTIGAGGGGNASFGTNQLGNSGSPSSLVSPNSPETITSNGGGRGGAYNAGPDAGTPGGSGGGGSANGGTPGYGYNPSTPGPVLTAVPLPSPYGLTQGNDGGAGNGTGGAGGGGAGGAGTSAAGSSGGSGGAGSPISISGSNVTYAAGGGGKISTPQDGTSGAQSSGNGGTANGATGGSGIVIVRYKIGNVDTNTAKATGGEISFYNNKTIHTFRSSGTFATEPNWSAADVEYVVIGGGGSGGFQLYLSGAGGAGAYRTGSTPIGAHPVSTSIQVGAGGAPMGAGPNVTPPAAIGTPSYFGTPITAPGGGGGGTYSSPGTGLAGGSGGGGAGSGTPLAGGTATGDPFPGTIGATPTNGWGHDGGDGFFPPNYGSGGGGGAGGAGGDGTASIGGDGGAGIQLPATYRDPRSTVGAPGPTSAPTPNGFDTSGKYWVAGGGGGSQYPTGGSPAPGGGPGGPYAGGGAGGAGGAGGDGGVNTGGGAGGQEREPGPATQAGRGGSGIVLIAYPT